MASIEEHYAPLAGKRCRQVERTVRERAHRGEIRECVPGIELLWLRLRHSSLRRHACGVRYLVAGPFFFFLRRPGRVLP